MKEWKDTKLNQVGMEEAILENDVHDDGSNSLLRKRELKKKKEIN